MFSASSADMLMSPYLMAAVRCKRACKLGIRRHTSDIGSTIVLILCEGLSVREWSSFGKGRIRAVPTHGRIWIVAFVRVGQCPIPGADH